MTTDLLIRVAGEAGQGVQTTGNLLVAALARMGLHVFAIKSYLSRIRGGLNWFDVRIGNATVYGGRESADVLVALTPAALDTLRPHVAEGGAIVFDADPGAADAPGGCLCVPLAAIAKETGGSAVMANAVATGAVFGLLGYDLSALTAYFAEAFRNKGDETVRANVACAEAGAQRLGGAAGGIEAPQPGGEPVSVASGTDAVGLGAATAGVKLVTAYPMTPATGVLTYLAGAADDYGIVVEQAEDEMAAINMVCGAVYAGVPALTMTSGGGFALMAEGLSLAGMHELPVVVILAQRPGPATGLPTRTAQQDLLFALHAGHGEFPRAIFAPGTPEQAYHLTRRALVIAHRFQTPVILMTDQYLADLVMDTPPLEATPKPIDRYLVAAGDDYVRYAVTDSGVSPRAAPGGQGFVLLDSDAHTADGHITEDLEAHLDQQDKRMRKVDGLTQKALAPDRYGRPDADLLLLCWGSTYGPCREAVDRLRAAGQKVAMLHFAQVWPLKPGAVRRAVGLEGDDARPPGRIVCVEGNQTSQFRTVLREAGVGVEAEPLVRYDGLPFTGEDIAERVQA